MGRAVKVLVTENRSRSKDAYGYHNNVRVFVDNNLTNGLWIKEQTLLSLLTAEQRDEYFTNPDHSPEFLVDVETARMIVDKGHTPYTKQKVLA